MKKPEYIQSIESKGEVFSVMVGPSIKGEFLKYLNDKKLTRVHESSTMDSDGKITFNKVIFKSQQAFYLCVENQTFIPAEPKFNLTIYYKSEQYNELYLFVSQLLKQFKNATTNNRTT